MNEPFQELVEAATFELSKQWNKALGDWLGSCVEKFCPKAYKRFELGDVLEAGRILEKEGYHFEKVNEGTTTKLRFLYGDVTLACAKIEVELFKRT